MLMIMEQAMQTFECKNCQFKQHPCFVCGKLGSSDKTAGAEVCFISFDAIMSLYFTSTYDIVTEDIQEYISDEQRL